MGTKVVNAVPVVHPRRHQTSRNSRHLSRPIERKNVLMLETVPDERLAAESLEELLSNSDCNNTRREPSSSSGQVDSVLAR